MKHSWEEAEKILESIFDMPKPRREKCEALFRYAQNTREGCIVELGTALGCGAIALALGAPRNTRVFTIDDYATRKGWAAEPYGPENERTCTENLGRAGVDVTIVKKPVQEAHRDWFAPIGLLHWDLGMLSRMGLDFTNWEPFVLKGGHLLMHDTMDRRLGSVGLEHSAIASRRFRKPMEVGGGLWDFEKRPSIVVCAGMSRSAGTLQYQIVHSILREADVGFGIGHGTNLLLYRGPDLLAFKSEEPKEWILDMVDAGRVDIVGIHRDPRDVGASLREWHTAREKVTGRVTDWAKDVRDAISWQKIWESYPDSYMARYETYCTELGWAQMVVEIANHLGISIGVDRAQVIASFWNLSRQEGRIREMVEEGLWFAQEWLLTQAHIGKEYGRVGRWKNDLAKDEAGLIEVMAGREWMANHGYRILDS